MKLSDYISQMPEGEELTVRDQTYDIEIYFYNDTTDSNDIWDQSMRELAKKLTIDEIKANAIYVKLANIIAKSVDRLKDADLFINYDIDSNMSDIPNIFAGYVGEKWFQRFVTALE